MKICNICHKSKEEEDFYRHPSTSDGLQEKCKECSKNYSRKNFWDNRERYRHYDTKRQRINVKRILSHKYSGIKARSLGRGTHYNSCVGKPFLTKDELFHWYEQTRDTFEKLYSDWAKHGFPKKLAPSIDRIDNSRGYTMDNIQWLTLSANSKKFRS